MTVRWLVLAAAILGQPGWAHARPCEALAADATNVYFVARAADARDYVYAAPRAGGPSRLLVDEHVHEGTCLIADGTRVLYTDETRLMAVPVAGGTPVRVTRAPVSDMSLDGNELFVLDTRKIEALAPDGTSRLVVQAQGGILAFVTDTTTVYWLEGDGGVRAVAKTGGTAWQVTAGAPIKTTCLESVAPDLVVDARSVYFTANHRLWRAPKRGGKPVLVTPDPVADWRQSQLQVDGDDVYVVTQKDGLVVLPKRGGRRRLIAGAEAAIVDGADVLWIAGHDVRRTPSRGGAEVLVTSSTARAASKEVVREVVPTTIATRLHAPRELALSPDGATTFVVTDDGLSAVPTAGGPPRLLHRGPIELVRADATRVYFVQGEVISSMEVTGGTPTTLAEPSDKPHRQERGITGLAVDDTDLYWTEYRTGLVWKLDKRGGAPISLATSAAPVDVAVDDDFVYWRDAPVSGVGQAIRRVPKRGGTSQLVAATEWAESLVIGADHIFWSAAHGRLMTALKDGTKLTTLATLTGEPKALAAGVDGTYVGSADGTLRRVTADGGVTLLYRGHRTDSLAARNGVLVWTDTTARYGEGAVVRSP